MTCWVSQVFAADYAVPDKDKATAAVKAIVADAAKSGKKVYIWVTLGAYVKAQLSKSDDKVLTVISEGNDFNIKWEKIPQEQFPTIAKNCIQDDPKRALVGMDYCLATGQLDKAEDFMTLAAANSAELGNDLKVRIKALADIRDAAKAAANPPPAAVVAAGSGDKDEPKAYKAPDKIAFRPSDFGSLTPIKDVAAAIDNSIEISLAEQGIHPEPICDDTAFLRRANLDITGEIPSPEDVIKFLGEGGGPAKRAKAIEELLKKPEYADHWGTFWSVLLVGRKTREEPDVKPNFFRSWIRGELARNEKFDKIVTDVLTATGENDKEGAVNYLTFHMNDTLPLTVGHISQTFLGARISCAQCHDHPFDKWTQQDFWGFASFLANTRSERKELREDPKDPEKITRAWHVLVDSDQRNGGQNYDPPQPELKLPPKVLDGPIFVSGVKPSNVNDGAGKKGKKVKEAPVAMADKNMMGDKGMMDKGMADKGMADKTKTMVSTKDKSMDKSMDSSMSTSMSGSEMASMMTMDDASMMSAAAGSSGTQGMLFRKAFAAWITSPKNEKFNQSAVNRIWRNMFGYGLVEPVDDIRPKNPPVYPEVMKILADDFNASGRDLQRLIAVIGNTRAYQRSSIGTLQKVDRVKQVRNFARAEVRPMTPEELFMAIVKATGGPEKAKMMEDGIRKRDANSGYGGNGGAMNPELADLTNLMGRFIGTSTAEDRAGKLQFEGTVAQALMMMHSQFMMGYIKTGVKRFKGDMTWLFATTLGRPPTPEEANAFSTMATDPEGMMWVLMNSSEFVTIH